MDINQKTILINAMHEFAMKVLSGNATFDKEIEILPEVVKALLMLSSTPY